MKEVRNTLTTQEEIGLEYHQIIIGIQQDYYLQSVILKQNRKNLTVLSA